MDKALEQDIIKTSKFLHYNIEQAVNAMLSDSDITAAQSHVLMFIMGSGEDVRASQIHRQLHISRATVSGLMKKLRAKGYVTIEGCENDERQKKITATEKARQHTEEIKGCMSRIEDIAFEDFTDEELETLHRLIRKMAGNLDNIKNTQINF
mgnify:CR=1 FL=1